MPHAPIGERQLTWDYTQAEVDPRAKSNLAGKLSRLSILVWRIGFSVGTWSAMMLRMSNSISGSGMNISLALACGSQSASSVRWPT
jgi:hypothetical protein